MNIQHNMSAASASRHLKLNEKGFRVSTQRLSTGYRINSAADDAAGLSISEKLRWQVRGMSRASENIGDGIALTQVADGALQEVHDLLQRMVELTVQAANDTNTEEDRVAIQQEISEIKSEINRISNDTEFNTIKLFKSTSTPKLDYDPMDLYVYRQDYPGVGTREGGIIYKGVRYAYEDMKNLNFDADGNIAAGTYEVEVEGKDGNPVTINLIFDGGDRIPSGRQYELKPDQNGISIDRILHPWSEIKNADGDSIKPLNNKGGEYSFTHAGMQITFDVEEGADLVTIISSLEKDGLDTYELRSKKYTILNQPVTPELDLTRIDGTDSIKVTPANAEYLPKHTDSNVGHYKIRADENEIKLVLPSSENLGAKEVVIETWTWDTLTPPLPDAKWGNQGGLNPSTDVVEDENNLQHYSFTDTKVFAKAGRPIPSQSYSGSLTLTSSVAGSLSLSARENVTSWFRDPDLFIKTTDPLTGKISYNFDPTKRAGLEQKIADLADNVVASYLGTTVHMNATTTDGANQVQGAMQITPAGAIENTRYSSVAIPSDRELKIQSSSRAYDNIPIRLCAIDTGILDLETVDVTSHLSASQSLDKIYSALDRISEIRSGFGATQNRLESAMRVDDIITENSQAAESQLRDADMAEESVTNSMHRILMQSGQSMLAQANMAPQNILQLFS